MKRLLVRERVLIVVMLAIAVPCFGADCDGDTMMHDALVTTGPLSEERCVALSELHKKLDGINPDYNYRDRMGLVRNFLLAHSNVNPDCIQFYIHFHREELPIFAAVLHDDIDNTQFLLARGANPNRSFTYVCETLPLLYHAKNCQIALMLLSAGARVESLPSNSIFYHILRHDFDPKLISLYSKHGVLVDCDESGGSPLHALVRKNFGPLSLYAQELINAGALLDVVQRTGIYKGLTAVQVMHVIMSMSTESQRKDCQEVFTTIKNTAMQRKRVIASDLQSHMAADLIPTVLAYYEKEQFDQTAEEITQCVGRVKKN